MLDRGGDSPPVTLVHLARAHIALKERKARCRKPQSGIGMMVGQEGKGKYQQLSV